MKEKKTKSLGVKILVPSMLVAIIVTLFGLISFRINFKKEFDRYIEENTFKEIERILNDATHICGDENINMDYVTTLAMNALNEGLFITIYDKNKNEIFDIEKHNMGMCADITKDIMRNMGKLNTESNIQEYTKDIRINNDIKGYIRIKFYGTTVYLQREMELITVVDKIILSIGLILILSYIIISMTISNKINKQISKVMRKATYIAKGYYDKKIEIGTDIIEIKKLEESINSLSDSIRDGEEMRKRLTGDISHELKTPLTNIQSHLEAIIDGVWEPTEDRLTSIKEETERLSKLVLDMEKLNKYDKEYIKLNYERVNILELITGVVNNFSKFIEEKNIKVNVSKENVMANVDKDKFTQAIVNLISNAINYSNKEGKIEIKLYEYDNNLAISIEDNGIGISKEDLPHIFERFYRADKSRTRLTGGSGIGLAVTKSIIDAHNGEIIASSELSEGSKFKIILPINRENNDK